MRILIIVDCYYPTTKSSAKLVHDLGVEFRSRGHQVTIVAPSEAISKEIEVSSEDDLQIVRVKTGRIKGAGLVARGWQEIRLSSNLWNGAGKFLCGHPCDIIVFYSPSIFFGSLVSRLKRCWHCPAYLVLRDIFPQWAVDAGVLNKGPAFWYFRRRELQQYAAADVIGVQTPANLRYFSEQLPQRKYRLEVLFNWTPPSEPNVPKSNFRAKLGLQDRVVFFFGGNIGVAQDMDNIIRLAENLRSEPSAFFLLMGEGSEVSRLSRLIETNKLLNIKLLPAVDQQEYLAILSEIDVGLLSLDRRLSTQNVPGKLMGYMQFSKPVLASVNPGNDLKQILDEADAGFCLVNGDDAGLATSALRLTQDVALRQRLGRNSRALLDKTFSVSRAADRILTVVGPEAR